MHEESDPLRNGTVGEGRRETCRSIKEVNYRISMLCFTKPLAHYSDKTILLVSRLGTSSSSFI